MPSWKRQRQQGQSKAWSLHDATAAQPIGLGAKAAARCGKSSKADRFWNAEEAPLPEGIAEPAVAAPPHARVEAMRLQRCTQLRKLLSRRCSAHGITEPVLAFERWLARCRLREETAPGADRGARGSRPRRALDPLLPSIAGRRPEPGLVEDLQRAYLPEALARQVAAELGSESEAAAAAVARAAAGKGVPPPQPVRVAEH
ncbi:unnamed protein product, partial [Prorocentrum cordatum]